MFRARSPRAATLLALFGAALGGVCAGYDLALSQAVVQRDAGWALFGQRYGELPGMFAFALAAAALYARPEPDAARRRWQREWSWLVCSIGLSAAALLSLYRFLDLRVSRLAAALLLLGTLVLTRVGRSWLGRGLPLSAALESACTWSVRLGVWSWLLVSALKLGWGRVRYRDLAPLAADFTAWYAPRGWTGHSSFPSGHAAMGWLLLPSLLIWPVGSAAYRWALAISVGWGVFVSASRVVLGAHYLSDVLFSSAFVCGVVAYALSSSRAQRELR
jgi:membrane-associated phospholipid phosphatase